MSFWNSLNESWATPPIFHLLLIFGSIEAFVLVWLNVSLTECSSTNKFHCQNACSCEKSFNLRFVRSELGPEDEQCRRGYSRGQRNTMSCQKVCVGKGRCTGDYEQVLRAITIQWWSYGLQVSTRYKTADN